MTQAERDIRRKLKVFDYAKETGNVSRACRYFGITRQAFYKWRRAYILKGEDGLINSKPCPENSKLRIPFAVEEKILHLRQNYHLGQLRILWYLERLPRHQGLFKWGIYIPY